MGVIILSQRYHFFLAMLEGRDGNEPWHQSKRHEIYNHRFLKLIVKMKRRKWQGR